MASADPGLSALSALSAPAEDPLHGDVEKLPNGELVEEDHPVAPDQFDPQYETSKYEIWSYYSYYIGNNGLTLFNFAPTAAQNLLSQAAVQRGGEGNEILSFAGSDRTINSIILLCNGISFAIQIVVFLILGSYADFGTFRPNILIVLSLIAWGIGFGWLGVHTENDWHIGLGLYIVGLIAYQLCLTYWTAAFPGLARNTKELRERATQFENGDLTREEYDFADSMKRNELSNTAFYVQSVAEVGILAVIVGILFGLNVNASTANNNWGLSVLVAFATGVWILVAMPWFWLEKRRPGQDPGMNIVLAGSWQLFRALKEVWQLRQSLFYLIGYFLLGDSLNTTVTVIATLQNEIVAYNTLQLTYLLIVGIAAQAVGILAYWNLQKRFQLSTKTMFNAVAVGIILLDGWGMIGIWTNKFGFHNTWEVWVYQAFYGLFVCPWYSYSQTMISEVTPRGKEFLFFSLFSIIGKTSSFIGPFISSAIIDDTGNNSSPFYFLFALSLASFLFLLFFVDVKKSRVEQAAFLEKERVAKEKNKGTEGESRLEKGG
ncbi:Autophagy-related 22 [Lecanosticta acicola]|uniref:Autophagy-related protein n=1 Tax=Lecanosticta acicola TaxID=111012 RepID=A0AAI9EDB0_9PEZI|nr:Autophagy-related 22 [Lecanosticta acicola]